MPDPQQSATSVQALILDQIKMVERNLSQRLDQQDKTQVEFKIETHQALDRIEGKVDKTNGRVTVLEKARERAQGVMFAFSWLPAALTALLTAGLTILIMALTGAVR